MESQPLPLSSEVMSALILAQYNPHRWKSIVDREKNTNALQTQSLEASCIVGFSANSTLPKDIAREIASFIKKPITDLTILHISHLVQHLQRQEVLRNGRGGEGLTLPLELTPRHRINEWLRKNQQPRLCFSQPAFKIEIRKQAHIALFRRLSLPCDTEAKLSTFFLLLLHRKC